MWQPDPLLRVLSYLNWNLVSRCRRVEQFRRLGLLQKWSERNRDHLGHYWIEKIGRCLTNRSPILDFMIRPVWCKSCGLSFSNYVFVSLLQALSETNRQEKERWTPGEASAWDPARSEGYHLPIFSVILVSCLQYMHSFYIGDSYLYASIPHIYYLCVSYILYNEYV